MNKILLLIAGSLFAYVASGYVEGLLYGDDKAESPNVEN